MARGVRPTIADVARAAGVSQGSVSLVLNDRPGLRDATRERVRQAAEDLGWAPSSSARSLSRSRAFALGLVLRREPEMFGADSFFPRFVAGVERTLATRGYALVLQMVGPERAAEEAAYRQLASSRRVDGVFLLDLRRREPRVDLLAELDLAAVAIGRPTGALGIPWLAIDDRPAVRETARHLVGLGHRRIAHVAGPSGYVHTAARRDAWRRALRAAGCAPGPVEVADLTGHGGADATTRLLGLAEPPTAVVYANDLMAIAGIAVLARAGLRVPDDLSVVGFDDAPVAAHSSPPLTTIAADVRLWGREAAASLLDVVTASDTAPTTGWLEPSRLVVRGSTGPPPPGPPPG